MDRERAVPEAPGISGSADSRSRGSGRLQRAMVERAASVIIKVSRIVGLVQANRRYLSRLRCSGVLALLVGAAAAHGQDATWLLSPGTSNWNTGANWMPATVPTGTAAFGASNTTSITLSNGS